jgi:hypothetical protein
MNAVECSKGMSCHENFSGVEDLGTDRDQRPVRAIRAYTLQDCRQSLCLERAIRHSPPQSASQLDWQTTSCSDFCAAISSLSATNSGNNAHVTAIDRYLNTCVRLNVSATPRASSRVVRRP